MIRKHSSEAEQETNECKACNRQNMIRKHSSETEQELMSVKLATD